MNNKMSNVLVIVSNIIVQNIILYLKSSIISILCSRLVTRTKKLQEHELSQKHNKENKSQEMQT
jgi:hypothetical protein